MSAIFRAIFYRPLYNGLIAFVSLVPGGNVGVAVILLTLVVKIILFPLSVSSVKTQLKLKEAEPELNALKEKYKNDNQEQARRMIALYRSKGINPFSGIFLVILQIPIIFALYFVFLRAGLPEMRQDLLYSFTPVPDQVSMMFLGFNMAASSFVLALLAGVSNFVQIRFSLPPAAPRKEGASFGEDLARSMNLQTRYVIPVFIFIIALKVSGAIALYWTVSSIFTIIQEIVIRRRYKKQA